MQTIQRIARVPLRASITAAKELFSEFRQIGSARKLKGQDKLQLGAGPHPLPGWANIDLTGNNIHWDLTRPLPLGGQSLRLVYTEHFIEHVTRDQALAILRNCRTALMPGGVIRISTPDLTKLASDYLSGTLVHMPHGDWYPDTPCRMLNEGMRNWGHQYLYDEAELKALLEEAGLSNVRRVERGKSDHPELRDLETRPDFADLIVEAIAT